MPIDGKIAVSVVNDNHFAVSPEPIAEDHTTVEDRVDPLTDRSRDIDSRVRDDGVEAGMTHVPERHGESAMNRPGELTVAPREAERWHRPPRPGRGERLQQALDLLLHPRQLDEGATLRGLLAADPRQDRRLAPAALAQLLLPCLQLPFYPRHVAPLPAQLAQNRVEMRAVGAILLDAPAFPEAQCLDGALSGGEVGGRGRRRHHTQISCRAHLVT